MISLEKTSLNELILLVREKNDAAFAELISRYAPMMNKVASGFTCRNLSQDELFSEACVALHRAALSYDLLRVDVTFGLYSKICVYHRLCDVIAKEDKVDYISDIDINTLSESENVESNLEMRERIDEYLRVARGMLSDYEYRVFIAFIDGESNREIAKKLGKDVKSIENAKARVLKRLRGSDVFRHI